jgi:hypothetical protein
MRWHRWRGGTEDPMRDVPAATHDAVKARLQNLPHAERLLAVLEGEEEDDRTLGRIFGEELPSGLVLAEEGAGPAVPEGV